MIRRFWSYLTKRSKVGSIDDKTLLLYQTIEALNLKLLFTYGYEMDKDVKNMLSVKGTVDQLLIETTKALTDTDYRTKSVVRE